MPNLSYATEKLRAAIESIHYAHADVRRLRALVPPPYAESPQDRPPTNPTCSCVEWSLHHAFRQQLVGLCELHGMMDLLDSGEDALIDRLLSMSYEDFKCWLDRFEHNGQLATDGWQR